MALLPKSQSLVVGKFGQEEDKEDSEANNSKQNHSLTPIINIKFAAKDKIDSVKVQNMKALIDNGTGAINLRSIIQMDNEPLHFLQAFQGNLIIKTNDYMKKTVQTAGSLCYVMMFQLLGVPNLNQKAREVSPFFESFTTSGVYIILTKREVYFWIGQDFYETYLDEKSYNRQATLISDSLYDKLLSAYDSLYEESMDQQKTEKFFIQGQEERRFKKLMSRECDQQYEDDGTDYEDDEDQGGDWAGGDEDDSLFLKYESPFLKRSAIPPQEPRLFCLFFNGIAVEYNSEDDNQEDEGQRLKSEREALIFKEIHAPLDQASLDQRGVFLLDFYCEAFIWVGKKVADKDRLLILQLAYQTLALLHPEQQQDEGHTTNDWLNKMTVTMVESGFEPELFKEAFVGWNNFDHTQMGGIHESSDEYENSSEEESKTEVVKQKSISKKEKKVVELLPENFWIN